MTTKEAKGIIKKINVLQMVYWMAFCSISGFATVYLLSNNISNGQIGIIIAVGSLLSVFTQFGTGIIIDKIQKLTIKKVMLLFIGLTMLSMVGVALLSGNVFLTALTYCLSIVFLMNLQPLVTSFIYDYINEGVPTSFSFGRGLGSMTYGLFSFFMGQWLESHSTLYIPVLSIIFMLIIFLLVWSMPEIKENQTKACETVKEEPTSVGNLNKKYPNFFLLVLGITIIFSFHTIINVFLPQIIYNVNGGDKEVGYAIALAAFCEIPIMLGFPKIERKFGVSRLLKISALFFFLKSILYLFAPSFIVIQLGQLLQSMSFALITPAYAHYINEWMSPNDRVKGQTFMMAGVTLGNVIGSLCGGQILDASNVHSLLLFGLVMAFIGMVIILLNVKEIHALKEE